MRIFKDFFGLIIILHLLAGLFISCKHDANTYVKKISVSVDTINVSYQISVKPILSKNCYSCHSTSVTTGGNGFDIENFSSLKNYLNISYRNDSIYGSKFMHIINEQGMVPYMPPTYKMTDFELSMTNKWINAGAPSN